MSPHRKALNILQDVVEGRQEALSILFNLARDNPEALCHASMSNFAEWSDEVMHLIIVGNNAVPAIKTIREKRSIGLKEAKDLYDAAVVMFKSTNDRNACRTLLEGKQ